MRLKLYLLLVPLFFAMCTNKSKLEKALDQAAKNRLELLKVLQHYTDEHKDSQKYQAACFLIENMPIHGFNCRTKEFYPIIDSLNRSDLNVHDLTRVFDSLVSNVKISPPVYHADIKTLSSDFLIKHIDQAFETWQNSYWYDETRFHDFCEYILPYAVSTEKREDWLDYYHSKYSNYLSSYLLSSDTLTIEDFCQKINEELIAESKMILNHKLPHEYPPIMVDNIRAGSCDDYTARTTYIMRSLGMPVCIDFSPQLRGLNAHSWNVLIGRDGATYPFSGFDEPISLWKVSQSSNWPKVFRKMYSIQEESLAAQDLGESLPGFLNSPTIKDVSSDYLHVSDVSLELTKVNGINPKIAYLCVFKDRWDPVHWGRVEKGKVNFTNMGLNFIYLPAYYQNNQLIAAGDPFLLDSLGQVHKIAPRLDQVQTLKLERKFWTSERTRMFIVRMLNGRFQGSNDAAFKNFDDLYTITQLPKMTYNTVDIAGGKKYRYVRYIGAEKSFTNVAEIEFYTKNGNETIKLTGKIIGTNNPPIDRRGYDKENAFDGDVLTFFNSTFDIKAWTGLDLKTPRSISKIRYLPRNDDNNIRLGDRYELVYWDNGKWNSLGEIIADDENLIYKNCPVGALFLLHNHTRGKEERIFTYENEEQIWW